MMRKYPLFKDLEKLLPFQIVSTLQKKGFIAYFAGGWVRDFLLSYESDDIDVATNATPEQVQEIFPHTKPIGAAFGIVLVIREKETVEVATFRKDGLYVDGRRPNKIETSTPDLDAHRRDFTINGMFYDPIKKELHDFVEGQKDLKKGIIRTIGTPWNRFREDKLRMLRAVRISHRFGFPIEKATRDAIISHADDLLPAVSIERVWHELEKMNKAPNFLKALQMLQDLNMLSVIFPEASKEIKLTTQSIKKAPLLLNIFSILFPTSSLEDWITLGTRFRASKKELKQAKELFQLWKEPPHETRSIWAHYYAKADFDIYLQICSLHQSKEWVTTHSKRHQELLPHIHRIQQRKSLISSKQIQELGISPGPTMGQLLVQAEKLSIDHDLHSPEDVLILLKKELPK